MQDNSENNYTVNVSYLSLNNYFTIDNTNIKTLFIVGRLNNWNNSITHTTSNTRLDFLNFVTYQPNIDSLINSQGTMDTNLENIKISASNNNDTKVPYIYLQDIFRTLQIY